MQAVLDKTAATAATAVAADAPQRPWLKHYPPGVAAEVEIDPRATLVDVLEHSFRQYASRDAAACMDVRLRYRDLDDL